MRSKIDFTKFDLEEYVSKFTDRDQSKSRPGEAWFKCCFHDENTASLKVTNRQAYYCHGCGAGGGSLDFIKQKNNMNTKEALNIIKELSGQESVPTEYVYEPEPFFAPTNVEALYSYNGGTVLKYRMPNKRFTWAHTVDMGATWWKGVGEQSVELYKPNGLDGTVILVEGEKDVDMLVSLGYKAASSPNGTFKWKDSFTEELKQSERIVIINDNDDAGVDGAMMCHIELLRNNIVAKRISPLEIHYMDKKGFDVCDMIEDIGTDAFTKKLNELIASEIRWDRHVYSDNEILAGVTGLGNSNDIEVIDVVDSVEVEIVEESGLGQEYDSFIQKAVSETLANGMISELTQVELQAQAKETKLGVRFIQNKIKTEVDRRRNEGSYLPRESKVMNIESLGLNVDISGSGYSIDPESNAIINPAGEEVIGHFLSFVGVVQDAELSQDSNVKLALAYNTPQNLSKINIMVVPKKELSTTLSTINVLSGHNINVTQVNGMQVVEYLQDLQNHFKDSTTVMKSLSRFGWYDGKLMPFEQEGSGIVFDPTVAQPVADKLMGSVGDREKSLQLISEMANYSEVNTVIMGTAVASLLVSYMNDGGNQSFALNVWAETSTGKSVTCQGVSSLFGYPFKDNGWWGDGTATLNKDMYHNALLGHLPNFIDDPALNRQYDSYAKRDYIYAVTSGQTRGRMNRDGMTAQETKQWCNTVIMTNESQFIDDSIAEGGARARCIEVQFDKKLDTETVERWIELMGNNYGHFASDLANVIRGKGKRELDKELKTLVRFFNSQGIFDKRAINLSYIMLGLEVLKETLGIEAIDPVKWLVKQVKATGALSDNERAFEKLMRRVDVSDNIYRNIYDYNGTFIGTFGFDKDNRKVLNLPLTTIQEYAKDDNFNYNKLVQWCYKTKRMYPKFDDNGMPLGVSITNGNMEVKVMQLYYEWQGLDVNNQFNETRFRLSDSEMVVENFRLEDSFNG